MGGLEAGEWVRMYAHTHNGEGRIEWPDGGCYLKQVHLLIEVWELLAAEIRTANEQRH